MDGFCGANHEVLMVDATNSTCFQRSLSSLTTVRSGIAFAFITNKGRARVRLCLSIYKGIGQLAAKELASQHSSELGMLINFVELLPVGTYWIERSGRVPGMFG